MSAELVGCLEKQSGLQATFAEQHGLPPEGLILVGWVKLNLQRHFRVAQR